MSFPEAFKGAQVNALDISKTPLICAGINASAADAWSWSCR